MNNSDVRWQQRLHNYNEALQQLSLAINLSQTRPLSDLEKQGLIQAFEFTHELAWNVMKDYFYYQGKSNITGSRDAIREAFSVGLIEDGTLWMEMIKSRNQTTHTYNLKIANEILQNIIHHYHHCFKQFLEKMQGILSNEQIH